MLAAPKDSMSLAMMMVNMAARTRPYLTGCIRAKHHLQKIFGAIGCHSQMAAWLRQTATATMWRVT